MTAVRRIVRRPPSEPVGDWPAHWPELLRRVHAARGSDARAAMPRLADLLPPSDLLGIDAAHVYGTRMQDGFFDGRRRDLVEGNPHISRRIHVKQLGKMP